MFLVLIVSSASLFSGSVNFESLHINYQSVYKLLLFAVVLFKQLCFLLANHVFRIKDELKDT